MIEKFTQSTTSLVGIIWLMMISVSSFWNNTVNRDISYKANIFEYNYSQNKTVNQKMYIMIDGKKYEVFTDQTSWLQF